MLINLRAYITQPSLFYSFWDNFLCQFQETILEKLVKTNNFSDHLKILRPDLLFWNLGLGSAKEISAVMKMAWIILDSLILVMKLIFYMAA